MSEKSKLIQELKDKPSRDAFVSSQMSIPLAFQIRALREQRGWTQKQLAEHAGMLQPRITAMERPSGGEPNLRTLKRLASAFDVALIVRFAPFSELIEWAEGFSPDTFEVPSFDDDPDLHEREAASVTVQTSDAIKKILTTPSEALTQLPGSALYRRADQQQGAQDPTDMGKVVRFDNYLKKSRKLSAVEMAHDEGQHDTHQNLSQRLRTIDQRAVK